MRIRSLIPALLFAGLLLPRPGAAAREPLRLTIAFTGDVMGYLDPCG